jgi:hypothetical protein
VILLYPFLVVAAVGLGLSTVAHVVSLCGLTLPGGRTVFALHIGIFIVWMPVVLIAARATSNVPRREIWKVLLLGCPRWMRLAVYVLFTYALLNFVIFAVLTTGKPPPLGAAPPGLPRANILSPSAP